MLEFCIQGCGQKGKASTMRGWGQFLLWNGTCQTGADFNTSHFNKKLIGAGYFFAGYEALFGPLNETLELKSPRDIDGHGTHTASTSAGSAVSNAICLDLLMERQEEWPRRPELQFTRFVGDWGAPRSTCLQLLIKLWQMGWISSPSQ